MNKGKLIVIEGAVDGIGKSTQFALLRDKLTALSYTVYGHHFPSYGTPQGAAVEAYLRGELGERSSLSPYLINALYATDRAVSWRTALHSHIEAGELLLLDRYTTSSLIYQSASLEDESDKLDFIRYVSDYEYVKLGIPAPDAVIFLDAPFETAEKLRRARLSNDGVQNDIHERDRDFMRRVWESAQLVSRVQGWTRIDCTDENGEMRSREAIHRDVLDSLSEVLI